MPKPAHASPETHGKPVKSRAGKAVSASQARSVYQYARGGIAKTNAASPETHGKPVKSRAGKAVSKGQG